MREQYTVDLKWVYNQEKAKLSVLLLLLLSEINKEKGTIQRILQYCGEKNYKLWNEARRCEL